MVERQYDLGEALAEGVLPAIGEMRAAQPMVGEQAGQALARANRVACQHDLTALLAQRGDVIGHRLVDIGVLRPLRREIARRVDREIDHPCAFGLVEARDQMDRPVIDRRLPLLVGQIEQFGRDRPVTAGLAALHLAAVFIIIGDRLEPRLAGGLGAGVADDHVAVGEMIEQGLEPFLEERQPMLHAGEAAAVADTAW